MNLIKSKAKIKFQIKKNAKKSLSLHQAKIDGTTPGIANNRRNNLSIVIWEKTDLSNKEDYFTYY